MMPGTHSRTPTTKKGYRAADAADAWKRTVDFLAVNIEKIKDASPSVGGWLVLYSET